MVLSAGASKGLESECCKGLCDLLVLGLVAALVVVVLPTVAITEVELALVCTCGVSAVWGGVQAVGAATGLVCMSCRVVSF